MNEDRDYHTIVFGLCVALIILTFIIAMVVETKAVEIDLEAIKQIESGGDPHAVGNAGEVGLYQIMPVVRKSYNQRTYHNYSRQDLFDPEINREIARWYLNERIPDMLRYYDLEVSVKNLIWSYNAGIGRCRDRIMPEVTKKYLERYENLVDKDVRGTSN